MCKNTLSKIKAIESAKALSPHVVKVYEVHLDCTADLVNVIVVHDETTADVYDVDRFGNLELADSCLMWDDPGHMEICRMADVNPRFTRIEDAA